MTCKLRIGIIGAGIGGVTLAGALARAGIRAHVFERAPAFAEVGAGLQITPNAVKVIRALGLLDDLRSVGFLPQNIVGRHWRTGRENFRTPLISECPRRYGAEFLHAHRADIHRILCIPVDSADVSFSNLCVSVTQTKQSAVAHFANGSAFEADLLVGADGIQSTVRRNLFGDAAPRFTGNMCWRTVIPFDNPPFDLVTPDSSFWLGPKGHVVTYYISSGRAVNVVAIRETSEWLSESWNLPSNQKELLAGYPEWHPNVLSLFSRAETVFKWGLFDRDPMPVWSMGRITLLGDAAHPMLPFLSQGAAMAIEDGYVLARTLTQETDLAVALKKYEALRIPRTTKVQLESRKRGKTYHISSPLKQLYRDASYRVKQIVNPYWSGLQASWVYSYDAVAEAAAADPITTTNH